MSNDPGLPQRPAFRNLDVHNVEQDGHKGLVLRDPLGIAEEAVFVPEGLLPIVGRFDGEKSIADIEAEVEAQQPGALPAGKVAELADEMDRRLLLDSPRFLQALHEATQHFLQGSMRAPTAAGSAGYPSEPEACKEALDSIVRIPEARQGPSPKGLVAPHIDIARGREGYSLAYSALAEHEPADLYLVFGTGHQGPGAVVTGLPLDWATPLGRVATDQDFVKRIHKRLGAAHPRDVFLHRQEHSLEFQMLFLRHQLQGHDFQVAGFLTGHLPCAADDVMQEDYLQEILKAFQEEIAAEQAAGRRVCIIAGADLAHVGPFFGDEQPNTQERLAELRDDDIQRLGFLQQGDLRAFHLAIEGTGNTDRICGTTPILLTAALCGGEGELLHYDQAAAPDGSQVVSYCAMRY